MKSNFEDYDDSYSGIGSEFNNDHYCFGSEFNDEYFGYDEFIVDDDDGFMLKFCSETNKHVRLFLEIDIDIISMYLRVSRDTAKILFCQYKWNVRNLDEEWLRDEEKVRKDFGLKPKVPGIEQLSVDATTKEMIFCGICMENYDINGVIGTGCGHLFCKECWRTYISSSINDDDGCIRFPIRCPQPSCHVLARGIIYSLASKEYKAKLYNYLRNSYIESRENIKCCPAAGCNSAVFYDHESRSSSDGRGFDVTCDCSHRFCCKCLGEAHSPVDCETVAKWKKKISGSGFETIHGLVSYYSKPCPSCKKPTKKNQGCMRMTCPPPCNFSFCWFCLNAWSEHDTVDRFLSCNRYERAKNNGKYAEVEADQMMKMSSAEISLHKYVHHYERWASNHSSRNKALVDMKTAVTYIEALRRAKIYLEHKKKLKARAGYISEMCGNDITRAWTQIIECRRILAWSYVYAYFLPDDEDNDKREEFETWQGRAEVSLERLHHCAEKDMYELASVRYSLKDLDQFCLNFCFLRDSTRICFENLVRALTKMTCRK